MAYYNKFPMLLMGSDLPAQIESHNSTLQNADTNIISGNHNIGPYRKGRFLMLSVVHTASGWSPSTITAEGVPLTQLVTAATGTIGSGQVRARIYGAHIPHFQTRSNALNGLSLPRTLGDASWTKSGSTISAN